MELKTMPNVLKKFERVIKSVDLTKKEEDKSQLYTVTLDRQYKVNGKETDTITGKTVKEVRSTIRANRLLSTQSKEDKAVKETKTSKKSTKPNPSKLTEKRMNDILDGETQLVPDVEVKLKNVTVVDNTKKEDKAPVKAKSTEKKTK